MGTTTDADGRGPRIHVIGCGGAGTNSVHRLVTTGLRGARTVAVNTDRDHLARTACDHRVLLGEGHIWTTGGRPEFAARLADRHEREVRGVVSGGDLTFVLAGLGGGVGTGLAPIVANWARDSGALVVGLATTPFRAERTRYDVARQGLDAMRAACNSFIVLDGDRLLDLAPDLPVEQAFGVLDHLTGEVVRGIADALRGPSLLQLNFPDLREVLDAGGTSTLLVGEGDPRDPDAVLASALDNPFLEVDPREATGAVIHLTSDPRLPLRSVDRVVSKLTGVLRRDARVAFGVRVDPEVEGVLRLMTVLTGVRPRALAAWEAPADQWEMP